MNFESIIVGGSYAGLRLHCSLRAPGASSVERPGQRRIASRTGTAPDAGRPAPGAILPRPAPLYLQDRMIEASA